MPNKLYSLVLIHPGEYIETQDFEAFGDHIADSACSRLFDKVALLVSHGVWRPAAMIDIEAATIVTLVATSWRDEK